MAFYKIYSPLSSFIAHTHDDQIARDGVRAVLIPYSPTFSRLIAYMVSSFLYGQ